MVEVCDPGNPPYIIQMGGTDAFKLAKNGTGTRWELWNTAHPSPIFMTSWPGVWKQHVALGMSMHYIFAFVFDNGLRSVKGGYVVGMDGEHTEGSGEAGEAA